jgi:hypothetical protein
MIKMPVKERYLRMRLDSPANVREYIRRLLRNLKCKGEDAEIENMGRVSQLLTVWLKSWELDKISDIEKRIEKLEKENEQQKLRG